MAAPAKISRPSSRIVLAGAAAVIAYLCIAISQIGWTEAWTPAGVGTAVSPAFDDLRNLVAAADCARHGIDVYTTPCGSHGAVLNYPPIWLSLLPFTDSDVPLLGALIDLCAIGVFAWLIRARRALWGFVSLAALISPSVMLGFETANADMIVFILTGLAVAAFAESRWGRMIAAFILLAAGMVLKLYPVFAIALAARFSARRALFAGGLAAATLLYALSIAADMKYIALNMQITPNYTYGYLVPFLVIDTERGVKDYSQAISLATDWPQICITLTVIFIIGASLFLWKKRVATPLVSANEAGNGFLCGAGIYCGTFLLASNYSYRLIFLLLCLPQLFEWCDAGKYRREAAALLLCLLFVLWTSAVPYPYIVSLMAQWALFCTFGYVMLANFLATVISAKPGTIRPSRAAAGANFPRPTHGASDATPGPGR